MLKKARFMLVIALTLILFIDRFSIANADSVDMSDYKDILVIASYSYSNDWENTIISGIKDYYNNDNYVKVEYLDSTEFESKDYYKNFSNLLSIKYESGDVDCIITLDDEAFDFALTYLFDEDSVCYQKPIFCLGLNNVVNITTEQKRYVDGIIDTQNGEDFLKLIAEVSPKVNDICLLLDESAYCDAFKKSIIKGNSVRDEKFNITCIKYNYLKDVTNLIEESDFDSYAFILAGTFYNDNTGVEVDAASTIKAIKSSSNAVIYTTLKDYVTEGALGGLINDGYNLGKIGASQFNSIIKSNVNYHGFTVATNLLDVCLINYKAMRYYDINPFYLPNNAIFLEKGKYDLLLPQYMINLLEFISIITVIFIIILSYLLRNNRKKSYITKKQLLQSEEREKIKTDYIILISHELRTPLNIIINTVKLLKLKTESDNYEKDYFLEKIEYVINNSKRLLKSVNNSIDLAKIESKVLAVNFRMENIVEVIDEIIDVTADFAKNFNVDIIFDPQEEIIETAIDKEKIERIILNLIVNSIKNITRKPGEIYIKCRRDNENIFISVEDNGRGISEEDKKHIFEKFFQVSSSVINRDNEGSGVGLYITKSLVEIHEGSIEVESRIGEGTTFNITLPIKIVDKEPKKTYSTGNNINELASLEFSDVIHNEGND